MKRRHANKLLFLLILLVIVQDLKALDTVRIASNENWRVALIKELQVIPDDKKEYTYEMLFNAPNINFQANVVDKRPTLKRYWAKVILENKNDKEELLTTESAYWDFVTLYIKYPNAEIKTINLGIQNTKYNPDFSVPAHSSVEIVALFESSGHFRREDNINLIFRKKLFALQSGGFWGYLDGVFFGILFGLSLYNFFLFISLRDRTYLWYTLYISGLSVSFITLFISAPPKLTEYFLPTYPTWVFYIKKISEPILWVSYIQFIRNFLRLAATLPTWDKIMKILLGLVVLQYIINLLGIYHYTGFYRGVIWNIVVIVGLIIALKAYFKGYRAAVFFLLGQSVVFIGQFIAVGYYLHMDALWLFPKSSLVDYFRSPNSFFSFCATEAMLFSFALANKYNLLQKDITRVKLEKEEEKQMFLAAQNQTLEKQVEERTHELSQSLNRLKATQNQLIQSEKMASLGELTAGIAHEIQNPLNFVNNFSSINLELIQDIEAERPLDKTSLSESEIYQMELISNLKKNSEKVIHHGKRIDGIVKSMLEHSKGTFNPNTKKEPANLNTICEECLKLASISYRAKEKSFSTTYECRFDPNLSKVNILSQDMSRAILNILNNAFYACTEKKKKIWVISDGDNAMEADEERYRPKIRVETSQSLMNVSIRISDNGQGIPPSVINKIFQPFFTTKPTGEGTGLGLSMTYDIVTKGHGGELNVKSIEGEGSEFEIVLPLNSGS